MEGAKISWDELTCVGYQVTDKAVKKLCKDMNDRRKEIQKQKNIAEKLPTVTKTNLENWKILKKSGDEYLASNAFVLLTSDYFQFSKTQCAVFKGADRAVFLDKREYTGPLYEQIDEAVGFVLRNIRLGVTIKGILRREDYELPVEAIREMIVNAHCHRNYADESCVQVAVYDNRLEVTSPGGFYNGLTLEDAILGHTKQRNKVIANAFKQIGLVEAWGTGFQRIQSSSVEYGLPAPEFIEAYDFFRVNLYRKELPIGGSQSIGNSAENNRNSIGEASAEHRNNIGDSSANNYSNAIQELNSTQNKILELLASNPRMTGKKLAEEIGIAQRNVEENIKKLKNLKVLVRHGSNKDGYWEVRKLERR